MPGVHLLWVQSPEISSAVQPGQFIMVRCGDGLDPLLRRPLSVHQVSAERDRLAFLVALVGRGTKWLASHKEGERLDLVGPLGRGFSIEQSSKNLLLVAGGIGIAPLFLLAQEALAQRYSLTMVLGASTAALVYPEELLPLDMKLVIITEDGTAGRKGMVTDPLPELGQWADQIFACGPTAMYQSMASHSILHQKPTQVSLEMRMGCGLGACYGCTLKTSRGQKQVCRDGPVFELEEIIWQEK